jgi:hypothetical protein
MLDCARESFRSGGVTVPVPNGKTVAAFVVVAIGRAKGLVQIAHEMNDPTNRECFHPALADRGSRRRAEGEVEKACPHRLTTG